MRRSALFITIFGLVLSSCKQSESNSTYTGSYFNLKSYFAKEAEHLAKAGLRVNKTVSKNLETENKQVTVKNWEAELSLFSGSDINKPAWKDNYTTIIAGRQIKYVCKNPDMRTKNIFVSKNLHGDVDHIFIVNQTNNTLYTSSEQLDYFPDSLYRIVKKQDVLIIGTNSYAITGKIIK